jgi:hypothetical protein
VNAPAIALYAIGPGTVNHLTICDLYHTIARLARIIERQQNELNARR